MNKYKRPSQTFLSPFRVIIPTGFVCPGSNQFGPKTSWNRTISPWYGPLFAADAIAIGTGRWGEDGKVGINGPCTTKEAFGSSRTNRPAALAPDWWVVRLSPFIPWLIEEPCSKIYIMPVFVPLFLYSYRKDLHLRFLGKLCMPDLTPVLIIHDASILLGLVFFARPRNRRSTWKPQPSWYFSSSPLVWRCPISPPTANLRYILYHESRPELLQQTLTGLDLNVVQRGPLNPEQSVYRWVSSTGILRPMFNWTPIPQTGPDPSLLAITSRTSSVHWWVSTPISLTEWWINFF